MNTKINLIDTPGYSISRRRRSPASGRRTGPGRGVGDGRGRGWGRRRCGLRGASGVRECSSCPDGQGARRLREGVPPDQAAADRRRSSRGDPVARAQLPRIINLFSQKCHLYKEGHEGCEYDEVTSPGVPGPLRPVTRKELIERIAETTTPCSSAISARKSDGRGHRRR